MIYQATLTEEILKRADIVDIISSYINVVKKGRNFVALCPFHDDHHPSMSISREKQIYKCYSCGNGGNAITFVMRYEHISYFDALKKVARLINYDDPRLEEDTRYVKKISEEDEILYSCLEDLTKFYQYGLLTEEGQIAKDYLLSRHIDLNMQQKYRLGYAFNDPKLTITHLEQKKYSLKNIENIGITKASRDLTSDMNAGRVIFPIDDMDGRIVGFSARRLLENSDLAKYVNTPETRLFQKSKILYNYSRIKDSLRHDKYLYVLEGFMDVFALDRIGINNAVALMGTALTKEHLDLFKRLNVEIRMCLDCDNPGKIATMKAISELDKAKINYRIVFLEGENRDPDEILNQDGPDRLRLFINSLVDSFTFILDYYKNVSPLSNEENIKKVIDYFVPFFANISDSLVYDNYLYKLSEATHYDPRALKAYLVKEKENRQRQKLHEEEKFVFSGDLNRTFSSLPLKEYRKLILTERYMLKEMLYFKEAVAYYDRNIGYFYDEVNRLIANFIIDYLSHHDKVDINVIYSSLEEGDFANKDEAEKVLSDLSSDNMPRLSYNEKTMDEYRDIINEQKNKIYQKEILQQSLNNNSDPLERARIIKEHNKIKKEALEKEFEEDGKRDDS